MPLQELLLEVIGLVGDALASPGPRPPAPARAPAHPADSEVIAIVLVGASWKLGADEDLFTHYRQHYAREFPALARLDRTIFARQAADFSRAKQLVQERLAAQLRGQGPL